MIWCVAFKQPDNRDYDNSLFIIWCFPKWRIWSIKVPGTIYVYCCQIRSRIRFCCYDAEVFRFRTLNMRQNDYILLTIFLFIFLNENSCILIQISLKLLGPFDYVRIGSDNNSTPKRRRSLFEPMMVLFSDAYIRHSASVCWARLITSYSNCENNAMHCQHKSTSNKVLRRIRLTIRQYWYA